MLFDSRDRFRSVFEAGLERMLDTGSLNLFILVCANASFDDRLFDRLRDRLQAEYDALLSGFQQAFRDGGQVAEAEDDLLVFLKMASIGFDSLQLTRQRSAGIWEIQFNHLRSFRPSRSSNQVVDSIRMPFDERGFHFNKPFMQQEAIWQGELLGRPVSLFYNKYPFVDLHALLVPEPEAGRPQYLERDVHEFAWQAVREWGATMPDVRIAYNALGAFASVNHLHLQLFVRERLLPVEQPLWAHNGGSECYPVDCHVFDDSARAGNFIDGLNTVNQTYNLLYTPQRLYILPRKKQGEFELAEWSNGFSWYELCGGMITFNAQDFTRLHAQGVAMELARAAPGPVNRP
jgi:diadenosine tetraphosphate (Ap4A) HIT family hydrolase